MKLVHYRKAEKIFVVDFSNFCMICYFGYQHAKKGDLFIGHVYGFMEKLFKMLSPYMGKEIAVVFAFDHTPTRKKELYPEYKQGRKKLDFDPKPDVKKMIKYFNCTIIEKEGEEADDVIASFCRSQIHRDVMIDVITTDKDIWQIAWQKNIRIYNTTKKKIVLGSDVQEAFGIKDHRKIPLWKSVFGDSSDNVKAAIPRIQKKLVIPLIDRCDGTVEGLINEFDKDKSLFTPKAWEKISSSHEALERNYQIIKLNTQLKIDEINKSGNERFLRSYMKRFKCDGFDEEIIYLTGGN